MVNPPSSCSLKRASAYSELARLCGANSSSA
jgi:hypothetical protein